MNPTQQLKMLIKNEIIKSLKNESLPLRSKNVYSKILVKFISMFNTQNDDKTDLYIEDAGEGSVHNYKNYNNKFVVKINPSNDMFIASQNIEVSKKFYDYVEKLAIKCGATNGISWGSEGIDSSGKWRLYGWLKIPGDKNF